MNDPFCCHLAYCWRLSLDNEPRNNTYDLSREVDRCTCLSTPQPIYHINASQPEISESYDTNIGIGLVSKQNSYRAVISNEFYPLGSVSRSVSKIIHRFFFLSFYLLVRFLTIWNHGWRKITLTNRNGFSDIPLCI